MLAQAEKEYGEARVTRTLDGLLLALEASKDFYAHILKLTIPPGNLSILGQGEETP